MNNSERNMQLMLEELHDRLDLAFETYYMDLREVHVRQIKLCLEGMYSVLADYENAPHNPDVVHDEENNSAQV